MDKTNKRRPLESIGQWKNRLILNNRKRALNYEGELEPAVVTAVDTGKNINQGTRLLGSKPNDYRVGQKSLFGQRKNRDTNTLGRRMVNWFTDKTHLTSPPTYTDGYGRELNAEVPITESAQGKELERMKDTAVKGMMISSLPLMGYGLYYEPIATAIGTGIGMAAYGGIKNTFNDANYFLKKYKGAEIHPSVGNSVAFLGSLPTGGFAKTYGDDVTRRGLELLMHETSNPNPLPAAQWWWKDASLKDKANAFKYMFTGKGNNYLSNYLRYARYKGIGDGDWTNADPDGPDAVRTYLYGEPLKGLTEIKNPNYGIHEEYIARNYPGKDIKVYEAVPNHYDTRVYASQEPTVINAEGVDGSMMFKNLDYYNSAGHYTQQGLTPEGLFTNEQDIWKFNPKDYYKKWLNPYKGEGWVKNIPLKWGLNIVDHYGTPFIVRTKWAKALPESDIPKPRFSKRFRKKSPGEKLSLTSILEDIE